MKKKNSDTGSSAHLAECVQSAGCSNCEDTTSKSLLCCDANTGSHHMTAIMKIWKHRKMSQNQPKSNTSQAIDPNLVKIYAKFTPRKHAYTTWASTILCKKILPSYKWWNVLLHNEAQLNILSYCLLNG